MEKRPVRAYSRRQPAEKQAAPARHKPVLYNAGTGRTNKCDLCPSGFDSETEVEVHRFISHRRKLEADFAKNFGCNICLKTFSSGELLRKHLEKQHLYINNQSAKIDLPVYVCHHCDLLFFNKTCLLIHLHKKHELGAHAKRCRYQSFKKHKIECPVCGKPVTGNNMLQHLDVIHTRSLKFCPVCMKKQETIASVPAHVDAEHPARYGCGFCDYEAESEMEIDGHLLAEHGKHGSSCKGRVRSPQDYFTRCRQSRRVGKIQFPDRGINLTDMVAVCVLCQQLCYSRAKMSQHVESEHGHGDAAPGAGAVARQNELTAKKVTVCHCGASFTNEVLYKHHVFKVHTLKESVEVELLTKVGDTLVELTTVKPENNEETDSQAYKIDENDDAHSQNDEINEIDETKSHIEEIKCQKSAHGPMSKEIKDCIDEW